MTHLLINMFFIDSDSEVLLIENFKEFFELLGISNKIEFINKPTSYREVVIPERGFLEKDNNCQQFKNMIEHIYHNIQPDNAWKTFDKNFLTRSQFDKALKNEFGMEAIDSFFYNNNYKIIYPEKLTLSYMIYLLRNAEVCATMAGTPQHNLLFSYEGQQITILEKNAFINSYTIALNQFKKFKATYINANISLYSVDIGCGPFIFSYTYKGMLEKYAKDHNMNSCDKKYIQKKYLKKCLRKYMKSYRALYYNKWYMSRNNIN